MRVEARWELAEGDEQVEIPWENRDTGTHYLNLREEPAAISKIEVARRQRPLYNLLVALNSADSVFSTVRAGAWFEPEAAPGTESSGFTSRVDLIFAPEEMNFDREQYEGLLQRLVDLLVRDAGETLTARLVVQRCQFRSANRPGFALAAFLTARGETPGQAELRWGLGLVRIQQALLFLSRVIRQHLGHPA